MERVVGFEPASLAWKAKSSPRRTPALERRLGFAPRLSKLDTYSVLKHTALMIVYSTFNVMSIDFFGIFGTGGRDRTGTPLALSERF